MLQRIISMEEINHMHFRSVQNRDEWDSVVKSFSRYDSFHLFDYHRINCDDASAPVLYISEGDYYRFAYPLIRRDLGNGYCDYTGVYGYTGPLYDGTGNISHHMIGLFEYLKNDGGVSIFSRINSFTAEPTYFDSLAGTTVFVDLTPGPANIKNGYKYNLRRDLRIARDNGLKIVYSKSDSDIISFFEIYSQTMERANAANTYYFGLDYFRSLINSKNINSKIVSCVFDDKIVASSIFLYSKDVVQYFLSGTEANFVHLMPSKLILDDAICSASVAGYKIFHLGGGVGGQSDGLFSFKKSFSSATADLYLTKVILNPNEYSLRSNELDRSKCFFPLYRSK